MPDEGAWLHACRQTQLRIEADDRDLRVRRIGAEGPDVDLAEHAAEADEVVIVDVRFAVDDDAVCFQSGLTVRSDAGADELVAVHPGDLDADLRVQLGKGRPHGGSFDAGSLLSVQHPLGTRGPRNQTTATFPERPRS